MNQKFTIRPKPQEGESLSGYIMRISEMNCIKVWGIMRYLGVRRNKVHHLDMLPQKIVDMSNFNCLLGGDEESILRMTFWNLLNKFYSNVTLEYKDFKRNVLTDEIVKNKRRYCVSCLRESGYYKLLWQVKEVDMCNIHFTKLQSGCSFCGTEQPYMASTLGMFLCFKCGNDISTQEELKIKDTNLINEQLKVIDNWLFLLSEKFSLDKYLNVYNKEEFLIIVSFYVSQMMEEVFDRAKISFFFSNEMTDYLRVIYKLSDGKYMSLKKVLKLSRTFKISLDRLFSLNIPETYIDSLNNYRSKFENKGLGVCLAPWCSSYKSDKSLIIIDSRNRIRNHYLFCICKGCFNKYGYNRNTDKWQNIDGFIDLLCNKVIPSLNSLETLSNIESKYKIDKNYLRNAIGYAANYKLLNEEILEKYEMKSVPNDITSYFSYLYNLVGTMRRNALKHFKWGSREFYYYFNLKEVQYYLIFEENMFFRKFPDFEDKKGKFKKEFQKLLEYYIETDKDINLKNLSTDLKCSDNTIYNYGLRNIMRAAVKKQREKRQVDNKESIINKAERYFEKIGSSNELLTCNKVYKDLDLDSRNLGLEERKALNSISSKVKEHNNKVKNNRTQKLIKQANKIVEEFSILGKEITYKNVALQLDIHESNLYKNVELKKAIDEARKSSN